MDFFGLTPVSELGEHFRVDLWVWSSLWDYCVQICPAIANDPGTGEHNDERPELSGEGAEALAAALIDELASGGAGTRVEWWVSTRSPARPAQPRLVTETLTETLTVDLLERFAAFLAASGGFEV